jgi:hypothetical protein
MARHLRVPTLLPEVHNRKTLHSGAFHYQIVVGLNLSSHLHELQIVHSFQAPDLAHDHSHMQDGLAHIARPRLALSPDHGGAFRHTPQGLAQISLLWYGELGLLDVELVPGVNRTHPPYPQASGI